jgi:hypothetical protein
LVPGCLQACKAFSVGENIIILLSAAISIAHFSSLSLQLVLLCLWCWTHHFLVHNHDHECVPGQNQWMHQTSHHQCSVVPEKGVRDR